MEEIIVGGESMKEAQSFVSRKPPNEAELKIQKEVNGTVYNYYQDKDGRWWYNTDKGKEIGESIEKWKKEK